MRCVGMAEVALDLLMSRAKERVAFGKHLYEHGSVANDIGRSRIEIDQARLLCMHTAKALDEKGAKGARKEISMPKSSAPNCCRMFPSAPCACTAPWAYRIRLHWLTCLGWACT